jgi:two-component system, sensor histidine kinase and response regulator
MLPVAVDGAMAALESLQQAAQVGSGFRLVVVDCHMPDMDGFELAERIKRSPSLASAAIMMLTSAGHRGDAARCRKLSIAAYLLKPIRKAELLSAILAVLGQEPAASVPSLVTRYNLQEEFRKLRILVAEDNPVNQTIALRTLEKLGHSPRLASNGQEALSLLQQEKFDLLFMDVQMPETDGLTATRAIREDERQTGRHIPIIAMTAHAMRGDRERCLDAGMDGYVSKPVSTVEIQKAITKALNQPMITARIEPSHTPPCKADWDRDKALETLGGDEQLLKEVVKIFLEETPKLIARLQQGVQDSTPEIIERAAHSLKGQLGYLGLEAIAKVARELEEAGRNKQLARASQLLTILIREIAITTSVLSEVAKAY